MDEVAQPLNLLTLARSHPGGTPVPGTGLEVLAVQQSVRQRLEQACWLLVLDGELIVDLPHGDFRILKAGESLRLPAGLEVSWQALGGAVVLRQSG